MKTSYQVIAAALIASILTFSLLQINSESANDQTKASAHFQQLDSKLADIATQLSNVTVALDRLSKQAASTPGPMNSVTTSRPMMIPDVRNPSVNSVLHPETPGAPPLNPDAQAQLVQTPKMIMVNPTPEQEKNFQVLNDKLDDPSYYSSMSLSELNTSPEMQSLPEAMRLAIVSKAIDHLNKGEVTEATFLGIPAR